MRRRPKLKITDIRTAEVRVHGYQVHVRIYTDQGIVGQGESTDAAQGNVPLIKSFARMLIGQDPLNIEAAFRTHPHLRHLRRRAVRPVRHRADGGRNRALGPCRQGAGPAGVSTAGRQGTRPRARLLRFRRAGDEPRRRALQGTNPRDPGNGFHRRQDRYRRRRRSRALRPRELDRLQRRDRSHGRQGRLHARELPEEHRPGGGHARALRRHHRQARRQGSRAVQAAVAGGTGAGRKHRRHARHSRLHQHAHLLRREHLPAARLPRDSGEARRRHHHAGLPEVRRPAGSAQDRRHGAHLLRARGAALPSRRPSA